MKCFVITTGNKERQESIEAQLSDINIKFSFFYSKTKEELENIIKEKKIKKESLKFRRKAMTVGEVGCFDSHFRLWEKCVELDEPILILEDNIEFVYNDGFNEIIHSEEVKRAGIVAFTLNPKALDYERFYKISNDMKPSCFFTICYVIYPHIAIKLKQRTEKYGYIIPVDKFMGIPIISRCYMYYSHICYVRRGKVESIANKTKGEKSNNPIYLIHRLLNKLKYKY